MGRHIEDHELMLSFEGELAPRRQARIAHHLDGCRVCRDRADGLRSAMAEAETCYRAAYSTASSSPDYGRVRLASALRDAASVEQRWFPRVLESLGGVSCSRGLRVAAAALVVCVAFIVIGPATEPPGGRLQWGTLPESSLTPGAVSELTAAELCNGVRPSRLVTEAVRQQVVRAYRMEGVPPAAYELDALITPELGGSTDPANLWPQAYHSPVWNAHVKDALERLLPDMVCHHEITLAEAQQAIAEDWVTAYKHYFKTGTPLRSHSGLSQNDDAELLFVPGETTQVSTIRLVSR